MIHRLALLALLTVTTSVCAFEARTGHWWNAAESGRGFNIDIQNGVLVVTIFNYEADGDSEWYISSGSLTNGGRNFSGTLDKYRNGQCISCAYKAPTGLGNDGAISISFTSETTAVLTLPGGRTTQIVPYDFGFGGPPNGLLGEWVYFYDIISTFAERFNFNVLGGATSTGTGTASDLAHSAICEYKSSGSLVGYVFCVDFNSDLTVVENQYHYRWSINEGYGGVYTFPPSGNQYSMKAVRTKDIKGNARALPDDPSTSAKRQQDASQAQATFIPPDGALAQEIDQMRVMLLQARNR